MNNFRGLLLIEYGLHLNKAQTSLALCSVCTIFGFMEQSIHPVK